MKKPLPYPLILLVCCHTSSYGQPVIGPEHFPLIEGATTSYSMFVDPAVFAPTPPGAEPQTWDYSAEPLEVDPTMGETMFVMAAEGTPGHTLFPAADRVMWWPSTDDYYWYLYSRIDPNGVYTEGLYSGVAAVEQYNIFHTNDLDMPFPFTYGIDVQVTSLVTTMFMTEDQASMTRRTVYTSLQGDAYGTLTLPFGAGPVEVVRMRRQPLGSIDSTFTDPSGTGLGPWEFVSTITTPTSSAYYTFWQAGTPSFALGVSEDGSNISFTDFSVVSVGNITPPQLNVYPNPVHDRLTFDLPKGKVVQMIVSNALGGEIGRYQVATADRLVIDTSRFAAGTYLYRSCDDKGLTIATGRFIVQ